MLIVTCIIYHIYTILSLHISFQKVLDLKQISLSSNSLKLTFKQFDIFRLYNFNGSAPLAYN